MKLRLLIVSFWGEAVSGISQWAHQGGKDSVRNLKTLFFWLPSQTTRKTIFSQGLQKPCSHLVLNTYFVAIFMLQMKPWSLPSISSMEDSINLLAYYWGSPVRIFHNTHSEFWGTILEDSTWTYKMRELDPEMYVGWGVWKLASRQDRYWAIQSTGLFPPHPATCCRHIPYKS